MQRLKRKNSKLNAATRGLASGIPQGFNMALNKRQVANQEENSRVSREIALKRARQVDTELQREDAARAASSEAVGEIADERNPYDAADKNPMGAGPAMTAVSLDASAQKVKRIAQELARQGHTEEARIFVGEARQKASRMADQSHREDVVERISKAMADGSLFTPNPDRSTTENTAINKSVEQLGEMLANEDVPAVALELKYNELLMGVSESKTHIDNKASFLNDLRTRMGSATEQQAMGANPQQGSGARVAQTRQQQKMNSLINNADAMFPLLFPRKPTAQSTKAAAQFFEQVALTEQGYAGVIKGPPDQMTGQPTTIPYTFEQEAGMQALMQDMQKTKLENEQLKADKTRADTEVSTKRGLNLDADTKKKEAETATVGPLADAKIDAMRQEALAKMVNAKSIQYSKNKGGLTDEKALALFTDAWKADLTKTETPLTPEIMIQGARALQEAMNGGGAAKADPIEGHVARIKALPEKERQGALEKLIQSGALGDADDPELTARIKALMESLK